MILSTILVLVCTLLKLNNNQYLILIIYFFDDLVTKIQNQSINKIYFENRNNMDLTHYNLIYQITECPIRSLVALPLIFINNIKLIIILIVIIIFILLVIYQKKEVEKISKKAQAKLAEEGINVRVIDIHTIKPIDEDIIVINDRKLRISYIDEFENLSSIIISFLIQKCFCSSKFR